MRRPRHATVVAYLALFVALGGSSYAAVKVGSKQIVNNSIASKDIRNNSVTSTDVRNRSLRVTDFKSGQLPRGQTGPLGRLATAPGVGTSRFFQLFNVDANTVILTCQVVGTATGCDSGDATATLPPSTRYSIRLFSGNPNPAPSLGAAWTFRMLSPIAGLYTRAR
jgi:hypothetical protein